MLFDLEDYRTGGYIGPNHRPVDQLYWPDPETTFRATRDAYLKAINEYFLASQVMSTKEEMVVLNTKMNDILESNLVLNPLALDFFNALFSTPILPGQAIEEGTRLRYASVPVNETSPDWFECIQPTNWKEGEKKVAVLDVENWEELYYKEMTQELYDSYKAALVDFQGKVRDLILTSEGIESFEEYVAPAVPVWNSYPELSGYVRGTNNLTIKDAVVRLVDLDGTNHDIVTDANGYYKFSKEMFYNSIAFDHSATASSVNMFVLSQKVGGAAIYDKTNIFQSSFFGAENSRSLTWEVSIKMGKQARRNFKLDFIPDYSNFPSFSGHVLDQNGNPVQNALVSIKDPFSGYAIGQRIVTNPNTGEVSYKYDKKYDFFGIERTILTDINGYYEYPSQMVGEWFNKYGFNLGISVDALTAPYITWNDNGTDRYSNEFLAILMPYVQNPLTDVVEFGDPAVRIYDNNDWFNSRFQYALNDQGVFHYNRFDMGQSYVIDVQETLVDAEHNAERLYFSTKEYSPSFNVKSTTGYVRLVSVEGTQIFGWGDPEQVFNVNLFSNNSGNIIESHIYSCEGIHGAADGKITYFEDNGYSTEINISEATGLTHLKIYNNQTLNFLDLEGKNTLTYLSIEYCPNLSSIDVLGLSNLNTLYVSNQNVLTTFVVENLETLPNTIDLTLLGNVSSSITRSTTDFVYEGKTLSYSFNSGILCSDKIGSGYIVGGSFNWIGNQQSGRIAKLNSDLSVDTAFSQNIEEGFNGEVKSVKVLPDGKILAVGQFDGFKGVNARRIAKLNFDGTLDTTFTNTVTNAIDNSMGVNWFNDVYVQDDGKIILIGMFWDNNGQHNHMVRLNTNGTIDTTFKANFNGGEVRKIVFQDSKILVIGSFDNFTDQTGNSIENTYKMVRLNSNGTLDTTFSNSINMNIYSIFIQEDGKILVGVDNMIFRINSNGTSDDSFTTPQLNGGVRNFSSLSDGGILITGWFNSVIFDQNVGFEPCSYLKLENNIFSKYNDYCLSGQINSTHLEENRIVSFGDLSQVSTDGFEYTSFDTNYRFVLDKVGAPTFSLDLPSSIGILALSQNGNVSSLTIQCTQLAMGSMPNLTYLDMSNCVLNQIQLTQLRSITTFIQPTDLSQVTYINIQNVSIPSFEIGSMPLLSAFYMYSCYNITELDFTGAGNTFSELILENMTSLTSVIGLHGHYNGLYVNAPISSLDLSNITYCRSLELSNVASSFVFPDLTALTGLESLVVRGFTGDLHIDCPTLRNLQLYNSNINNLTTGIITTTSNTYLEIVGIVNSIDLKNWVGLSRVNFRYLNAQTIDLSTLNNIYELYFEGLRNIDNLYMPVSNNLRYVYMLYNGNLPYEKYNQLMNSLFTGMSLYSANSGERIVYVSQWPQYTLSAQGSLDRTAVINKGFQYRAW